jgi:hypothetical protein
VLIGGVTGGNDHVVDDNRSSVGQVHLFGAVVAGDEINRGGGAMNDVDTRRRAGPPPAV